MLGLALFVLVWAVLNARFDERRTPDPVADRLGRRLIVAGIVAIVIGMAVKLLFITADEIDAGVAPAKFSMRTLWFVAFTAVAMWVLGATKFGSWTFAVGGNKEAVAPGRRARPPAPRRSCSCSCRGPPGWSACCSPSASTRSRPTPATVRSSTTSSPPSSAARCSPVATARRSAARSVRCIMAMAMLGIPFARWNSDWRFLFLGVILLLAMLANRWIRTKAEAMRR